MKKYALVVCNLAVVGFSYSLAHGAPQGGKVTDVSQAFEWVDLTKCTTPRVKPPAMPKESDEEYGFDRRYLALGAGKSCVLMESYVQALSGSYSSGMQVLGTRYYRFLDGKWHLAQMPFMYFPYALRRKEDGQQFFVQAVLEQDVGVKYPGASGQNPGVFVPQRLSIKGQKHGPGDWAFESDSNVHGPVLQGLAVVLSRRLRAGSLASESEIQIGIERKRIRFLLETAWQTLAPDERAELDADGMPR
jgi:hypothetical protein